jgi:hypothetical protein
MGGVFVELPGMFSDANGSRSLSGTVTRLAVRWWNEVAEKKQITMQYLGSYSDVSDMTL